MNYIQPVNVEIATPQTHVDHQTQDWIMRIFFNKDNLVRLKIAA